MMGEFALFIRLLYSIIMPRGMSGNSLESTICDCVHPGQLRIGPQYGCFPFIHCGPQSGKTLLWIGASGWNLETTTRDYADTDKWRIKSSVQVCKYSVIYCLRGARLTYSCSSNYTRRICWPYLQIGIRLTFLWRYIFERKFSMSLWCIIRKGRAALLDEFQSSCACELSSSR